MGATLLWYYKEKKKRKNDQVKLLSADFLRDEGYLLPQIQTPQLQI